jgi:pimeloyl-ACP methyl ester carboxylesterase
MHLANIFRARSFLLFAALVAGNATALECGQFDFPFCQNAAAKPAQFAGGFNPGVGFGGFGGGDCRGRIAHTPVVFVHGNGDSAIGWDSPALERAGKPARPSVYRDFKSQGYNDCELFGVTYLDRDEQRLSGTSRNAHQPKKYEIVWRFIEAVKAYTGARQVDIVGHSLGVSMTLATLDYYADHGQDAWSSVRRFVNIAGGIRGLNACVPGVMTATTCEQEQSGAKDAFYQFGFYPDGSLPWLANRWTAASGDHSLRLAARHHPGIAFYTIDAGNSDDIHCSQPYWQWLSGLDCKQGPLFAAAPNVRAQIDIGANPSSPPPSWTTKVASDVAKLVPHDLGGIGHFGARDYAGPLVVRMLTTDCRGLDCARSYGEPARQGE